ncbi:hypothetical protein EDD21DRAFT_109904 [Dissophora ornata]|nr:hypothetical protein EDD21DRAFT_109904 [Dissophora ornata]
MLKRISTLARGVLRRQSSPSLLNGQNPDVFTASPTNITPPTSSNSTSSPNNTSFTISSTEFSRYVIPRENSNVTRRASMDIPRTLSACAAAAANAASENRIETVTDQEACSMVDLKAVAEGRDLEVNALAVSSNNRNAPRGGSSSTLASSAASVADDASLPYRHPNRASTTYSEASSASVGSLTLAPSSESLHVKIITTTITAAATPPPPVVTTTRPTIPGRHLSSSMSDRQKKFLKDLGYDSFQDSGRDCQSGGTAGGVGVVAVGAVVSTITRQATLRSGTQALITEKAESLQRQQLKFQQLKQEQQEQYEQYHKNQPQQVEVEVDGERKRSPGFVSRPSIDRLRTITQREVEKKPPVKSLISFWEQSKEAIEV